MTKIFTQEALKKFDKVSVCVVGGEKNLFKNGRKSHWFKVYNANPDEVTAIIKEALNS